MHTYSQIKKKCCLLYSTDCISFFYFDVTVLNLFRMFTQFQLNNSMCELQSIQKFLKSIFPNYILFATTHSEFCIQNSNENTNTRNFLNQILSQQIIKKYSRTHTENRENVPRDFACYFYWISCYCHFALNLYPLLDQ